MWGMYCPQYINSYMNIHVLARDGNSFHKRLQVQMKGNWQEDFRKKYICSFYIRSTLKKTSHIPGYKTGPNRNHLCNHNIFHHSHHFVVYPLTDTAWISNSCHQLMTLMGDFHIEMDVKRRTWSGFSYHGLADLHIERCKSVGRLFCYLWWVFFNIYLNSLNHGCLIVKKQFFTNHKKDKVMLQNFDWESTPTKASEQQGSLVRG